MSKVFILLATFNRAHLIGETLESIMMQTYKNWECIIVDDFSTDGTKEVIKQFQKRDQRISYFSKPKQYKKGLSGSRNFSLDLAFERGAEFVQFCDDDDIVHPENLRICLNLLKGSEHYFCHYSKKSFQDKDLVIFNVNTVDITPYEISLHNLPDVISNKIPMSSCTVMWKSVCFNQVRFNEDLLYAEEWECFPRVLTEGYTGIGIKNILYFNRKHRESNTNEFWSGVSLRRSSKVKAVKLVIENLSQKNLLTPYLISHFVKLGIFLKDVSIVIWVIEKGKIKFWKRMRYLLLYYFYPVIGRLHRFRKKFL